MSDDLPPWIDDGPKQSVVRQPPKPVNELAEVDEQTRTVMTTLRNSLYPGASWGSIEMVLAWCRVNKIDPFLKCVHLVPMSVKIPGTRNYEWRDVLMPGIADYRIKASRSREYVGKSEPVFGPTIDYTLGGEKISIPEWCKITVKRLTAGVVAEFTATEFWIENYATAGRDTLKPNAMWFRRGRGQLAKCTEAQALRMAFPEFGGVPTAEEMEGKRYEDIEPSSVHMLEAPSTKLDAFEQMNGAKEPEPIPEPPRVPSKPVTQAETEAAMLAAQIERLPTLGRHDDYLRKPKLIEWLAETRIDHPDIVADIETALRDKKVLLTKQTEGTT